MMESSPGRSGALVGLMSLEGEGEEQRRTTTREKIAMMLRICHDGER